MGLAATSFGQGYQNDRANCQRMREQFESEEGESLTMKSGLGLVGVDSVVFSNRDGSGIGSFARAVHR